MSSCVIFWFSTAGIIEHCLQPLWRLRFFGWSFYFRLLAVLWSLQGLFVVLARLASSCSWQVYYSRWGLGLGRVVCKIKGWRLSLVVIIAWIMMPHSLFLPVTWCLNTKGTSNGLTVYVREAIDLVTFCHSFFRSSPAVTVAPYGSCVWHECHHRAFRVGHRTLSSGQVAAFGEYGACVAFTIFFFKVSVKKMRIPKRSKHTQKARRTTVSIIASGTAWLM